MEIEGKQAETMDQIDLRIKNFGAFIKELYTVRLECDRDSLFDVFKKHNAGIRELVLLATQEKLISLDEKIGGNGTKKKGKKFVPLTEFETNKNVLKTFIAVRSELEAQREEYINKLGYIEAVLIKFERKTSSSKIIPNESGIDLLGDELVKEHKRMVQGLPIYAWRSNITAVIKNNQFVVLKGETGSGKSTQLPQYILEGIPSASKKIIVTQPRKVAAISLAHRIADEQREELGNTVGYWVGMAKNCTDSTRLLLMTDRMLLNYCLEHPQLDEVSCVIVDEAHERSVNTDLLLGMVKKAAIARPELKVIVTSATISTKLFSDYFYGCPVIEVPGRIFPVDEFFEPNADAITATYVKQAAIKALEIHASKEKGDILVFLTSPVEIENAMAEFQRMSKKTKSCVVLPLHGKLQPNEQMKVFEILPNDIRKIVFSTNVAETSVTIPGIKFVIDSGMVKERFYDAKKGLNYLDVKMISKSSAIQRKGRAGRTGPGICIRLYSKEDYDALEESNEPEIKKMHLGSAVLSLMALGVPDVMSFDFIEPPDRDALTNSIKTLQMLGAIRHLGHQPGSCRLTQQGKDMAKLPLEPRGARIVLLGTEAGCTIEAVTMTAIMVYSSSVHIRIGDDDEKKAADEAKMKFANEDGDLFSILDVFQEWDKVHEKKKKNEWCVKHFINAKTMRSIKELQGEIYHALKATDARSPRGKELSAEEKRCVLTDLIVSTFYDNIGCFTGHGRIGYISPKHKELFIIHPSSVLCSLAMEPQFVVFQDVLKTSASYIVGITPVKMNSLLSLCPHPNHRINFAEVRQMQISATKFQNFGSIVTRAVIGKRGETLKRLQNEIKDGSTFPGLIEVSVEKGTVVVYTTEPRKERATQILSTYIRQQISTLEKETRQESIGENLTGYRVVIAPGLQVQELLLPSESLEIEIYVRRLTGYPSTIQELEDVNVEVQSALTTIETLSDICLNKLPNDWQSSNFKWGTATFTQLTGVNDALRKIMFEFNGAQVNAKSIVKPSKGARDSQSLVTVAVTWSRRKSRGMGNIKCKSEADAIRCLQSLHYGHGELSGVFSLDKRDPKNVFARGINRDLNNDEFKRLVEKRVNPLPVMNEENLEQAEENSTPFEDAYIVYEKVGETDLVKEQCDFEQQLKRILSDLELVSIFMFPIQKQTTVTSKARLSFKHFEHAERAVHRLNDDIRIGTQSNKAVILTKTQFFCKNEVFDCLSDELKMLSEIAKDYKAKIEVSDTKSRTSKMVILSGDNTFMYNEFRGRLKQIMDGEVIEDIQVSQNCFEVMKERIRFLEKRIPNTKIDYDSRTERFSVYGRPEMKKVLGDALRGIYTELSLNSTVKVSLRGNGRSSGLLKALMTEYGAEMHKALPTKDAGTIQINLRQHTVLITGPERLQQHIKCLIDQCEAKLRRSRGQANDHAVDEDSEECNICFCEPDEKQYRLQTCGHVYCSSCLDRFLESCTRDKTFPVTCCKDGCEKKLVLKDLDLLTGNAKERRDKMTKAAISALVTKNPNCFKYCPTANCSMIYRVSKDAKVFFCALCGKKTCTVCHADAQDGHLCEGDDKQLLEFGTRQGWKQCQKCKQLIEKNMGCLHVACRCGAHICWKCGNVFETSNECYNHLGHCGTRGNIF